jgi:hypothetical protein
MHKYYTTARFAGRSFLILIRGQSGPVVEWQLLVLHLWKAAIHGHLFGQPYGIEQA